MHTKLKAGARWSGQVRQSRPARAIRLQRGDHQRHSAAQRCMCLDLRAYLMICHDQPFLRRLTPTSQTAALTRPRGPTKLTV